MQTSLLSSNAVSQIRLCGEAVAGATDISTKVAVIQKPPVLLHRESTIESALASIEEAVRAGATLLVFPEAYVPGYPTWIWRLRPGGEMALASELHARLRENSVDLDRGDMQRWRSSILLGLP